MSSDFPGPPPPSHDLSLIPPPEAPLPRWGLVDVVLGAIVILFGASATAAVTAVGLVAFSIYELEDLVVSRVPAATLLPLLCASILSQQALMLGWPLWVSSRKGNGPAQDWGLSFKSKDLGIGLAVAVVGLGLAALMSYLLTAITGLSDGSAAENTAIITGAQGSPWFWPIVFAVVVGAPWSEELFFRGLLLRAAEKKWSKGIALIVSTIVFTIVHYSGMSWEANIVLLGSIAPIGLLLGATTIMTGRLTGSIFAHMLFNIVGVIVAVNDLTV